jgi:DNA polymerase-4
MAHNPPRRIMHIDMDAYFASLEQAKNPLLANRPVVVGSSPGQRGVVSTASYEARVYGIRSGMSSTQAGRLCPDAVFIGVDAGHYTSTSSGLLQIFEFYSPRVEVVSIDEAFIDITGCSHLFGGEELLATHLKRSIKDQLSLTCSIGIAPSKIMAKLASTVFKPDGLTILTREDIPAIVYPLPVGKLWGVGPVTVKALNAMGIKSIGQLASTDIPDLRRCFGKYGEMLGRLARGEGNSEIQPFDQQPDEKSVGHERTFARDIGNMDYLKATLNYLADLVGRRLRRLDFAGRTITLKYRFADFETHSRRTTIDAHTNDTTRIYSVACTLMKQALPPGRKVRLLGISLSHLTHPGRTHDQLDMFSRRPPLKTTRKIDDLVDTIRNRFGERAIYSAYSKMRAV